MRQIISEENCSGKIPQKILGVVYGSGTATHSISNLVYCSCILLLPRCTYVYVKYWKQQYYYCCCTWPSRFLEHVHDSYDDLYKKERDAVPTLSAKTTTR